MPARRPLLRSGRRFSLLFSTREAVDAGPDVTAPTLESIVIGADGLDATFTYSEALDETSTPAPGDYVWGGTLSVSDSVVVSGATVVVAFDTAVLEGETVTVDYTAGANPIRDLALNEADNLVAEPVTNNSEVTAGDTDPPGGSSIVINADGVSGRITFDEPMNVGALPTAGSLTLNNTPATVVPSAWNSATELDFTIGTNRVIGSAFTAGGTITMSYTAGATPLEDAAGNDLPNFSGAAITNNSIHAPALHLETLLSGTSWTSPADLYGDELFAEGWAAGEGGQTATKAGDSGWYCNVTDTIAPNTAYSYAIGAAGTVGGGNGGDITWRTSVMVVPGGASATAAVGDVTRAGQTGASGSGNTTPGGSPGTDGDASGSTSGPPNGATGATGNVNARLPGAGGGSTAAAQRAGAAGYLRLQCHRHPPLTGAYVTAFAEYRATANGTTTGALAAPGTHQAGDRIALHAAFGAASVAPACAQATSEIIEVQHATAGCLVLYDREATGSDDMTVTTTPSCSWAVHMRRIRGASGAPEVNTGATGTNSAPTPATHTPTGGSQSRLVITAAAFCAGSTNNNSPSNFPTNYRTCYTPQRNANTVSAGLGCAVNTETASSYSPAWTGSIENWAAATATWE